MDLSFSPDVDARICYLIVLLCALVAAYRQVDRRLMEDIAADRSRFDALMQLARSLTRNLASLDKKITDLEANATVTDQWRTREALTAYVADPATTLTMSARIARLARGPAMQPGRIEVALQVLIAGAKRAKQVPLVAREIVGALRAPVVDNRTRQHSALLYLAQVQTGADPCLTTAPATLPKELCEWKPTDGDSIVDIEDRIDRWTAFWAKYLPPSPPGDAAPAAQK